MRQSYNGNVYDTEKAVLIASEVPCGFERGSRFLYRTDKGEFFHHIVGPLSLCGSSERIEPLTEEQALQEYNQLPDRELGFEDAFPNMTFEDA